MNQGPCGWRPAVPGVSWGCRRRRAPRGRHEALLADRGDAGGGCDRLAQADVVVWRRGLVVIHAPESLVTVHLARNAGRRLSHPRGGELPVVPRVEGGGVNDQGRHLGAAAPVVLPRM